MFVCFCYSEFHVRLHTSSLHVPVRPAGTRIQEGLPHIQGEGRRRGPRGPVRGLQRPTVQDARNRHWRGKQHEVCDSTGLSRQGPGGVQDDKHSQREALPLFLDQLEEPQAASGKRCQVRREDLPRLAHPGRPQVQHQLLGSLHRPDVQGTMGVC